MSSETDCADCLCRVCAHNEYFDNYNEEYEMVEPFYKDCVPCEYCKIGEATVVEIEDDCPRRSFLGGED